MFLSSFNIFKCCICNSCSLWALSIYLDSASSSSCISQNQEWKYSLCYQSASFIYSTGCQNVLTLLVFVLHNTSLVSTISTTTKSLVSKFFYPHDTSRLHKQAFSKQTVFQCPKITFHGNVYCWCCHNFKFRGYQLRLLIMQFRTSVWMISLKEETADFSTLSHTPLFHFTNLLWALQIPHSLFVNIGFELLEIIIEILTLSPGRTIGSCFVPNLCSIL